MLCRLSGLKMPAHLFEFPAGSELFVNLGGLTDDLIRRVPPALAGCRGAVIPPALTVNTVAQHLKRNEGLRSNKLGWGKAVTAPYSIEMYTPIEY